MHLLTYQRSVWKPLDHPVDEWPLALCGGETIAPSTLLETDQVRRDNITTVYYTAYAKEQKWHFLERQTPEEVLIFKHFDSDPEVRSSCKWQRRHSFLHP